MQYGLLGAAIIGVVAALKFSEKINGLLTIVVAVALGALAGWGGVEGLTVVSGILTGCAAVGVVYVASKVSGK